MKKIFAMAAIAALAAGASAYAANPFSDVSTSDWAYKAVSQLSDQGIVEGYPDGTFKGQSNITRYEMAQIIARLMAREDQYNAEQRATIDKLAGEYADELDALGVRVGNLEKKVGNISWSGDARMRFQRIGADAKDKYNGRIRIGMRGDVNDNTFVYGRLASTADLKNGSSANTEMDRLYVQHNFGAGALKLGRYEVDMGTQLSWLYGNAFDGAELSGKLGDNVSVAVGYGRFRDAKDLVKTASKGNTLHDSFKSAEVLYAQAKANLGAAKLGVDYYRTSQSAYSIRNKDGQPDTWWEGKNLGASEFGYKSEVIGANLVIPAGDFRVFGDYYKETSAFNKPDIWTAGIGYGMMNLKKPGSFALDVAYFDVEEGLYHTGMTGTHLGDSLFQQDGHFYLASLNLALAKNTFLHGEYAFAHDGDNGKNQDSQWTASLNYKF